MSEPEVKFEIDEHGRIGYRVTNEGVLLSKDEKEFIIDHITRMQEENAKLRKLVKDLHTLAYSVLPERKSDYITICSVESCIDYYSRTMPAIEQRMRELGVEL